MPKQNKMIEGIPLLYKRSTLHHLLYGFISGARCMHPSITIKEAGIAFTKHFKIAPDNYTTEHITKMHELISKDIADAERNENG
jgi:hypothetical protein